MEVGKVKKGNRLRKRKREKILGKRPRKRGKGTFTTAAGRKSRVRARKGTSLRSRSMRKRGRIDTGNSAEIEQQKKNRRRGRRRAARKSTGKKKASGKGNRTVEYEPPRGLRAQ